MVPSGESRPDLGTIARFCRENVSRQKGMLRPFGHAICEAVARVVDTTNALETVDGPRLRACWPEIADLVTGKLDTTGPSGHKAPWGSEPRCDGVATTRR